MFFEFQLSFPMLKTQAGYRAVFDAAQRVRVKVVIKKRTVVNMSR